MAKIEIAKTELMRPCKYKELFAQQKVNICMKYGFMFLRRVEWIRRGGKQ